MRIQEGVRVYTYWPPRFSRYMGRSNLALQLRAGRPIPTTVYSLGKRAVANRGEDMMPASKPVKRADPLALIEHGINWSGCGEPSWSCEWWLPFGVATVAERFTTRITWRLGRGRLEVARTSDARFTRANLRELHLLVGCTCECGQSIE
jgi:hypothetical protein